MKILLVSQYFWPETFRVNDLAQELVLRGNEVTVLTGKPNYPQGAIYKGYSFWGYKKEYYKGIELIRVPLIPRGKGSGLRLALNYLSFVLFSCLYILFHKRKFDVSLTFAILLLLRCMQLYFTKSCLVAVLIFGFRICGLKVCPLRVR